MSLIEVTPRGGYLDIRKVYTTGDVARAFGVSHHTAVMWCDRGLLKHFRIPGSKDRRIPHQALVEFLEAHGFDLEHVFGPDYDGR